MCRTDWMLWLILILRLGCVYYKQPVILGWNSHVRCHSATPVGLNLRWAIGTFQAFWQAFARGSAGGFQQSNDCDNYDVLRYGPAQAPSVDCCDCRDFSNGWWRRLVSTCWLTVVEQLRDVLGVSLSSVDSCNNTFAAFADDAGYCGWKCADQKARPLALIRSELHSFLGSLGNCPGLQVGVMGTSLIQTLSSVVTLGWLAPSNLGSWHSDRRFSAAQNGPVKHVQTALASMPCATFQQP